MQGREIVSRRVLRDVSQADLAAARGCAVATLCDVENDKIELSRAEYSRLKRIIDSIAESKSARQVA